MTPDQIRAHLALHGWEAWVEHPIIGERHNLTHPAHGTFWLSPGTEIAHRADAYRFGFTDAFAADALGAKRIEMGLVPDHQLGVLWAKIQEVCHDT